jgi:hypothetical protein
MQTSYDIEQIAFRMKLADYSDPAVIIMFGINETEHGWVVAYV